MAREIKELRLFNAGLITSASLSDSPDESAQYSLNVEPVAEAGILKGITEGKVLFPHGGNSSTSAIQPTSMVLLDTGETEDLIIYEPDRGLNYIADWYGSAPSFGGDWHVSYSTTGKAAIATRNKEAHIGFGHKAVDSRPQWMGYSKVNQFGATSGNSMIVTDTELTPFQNKNSTYICDKVIRPVVDLSNRPTETTINDSGPEFSEDRFTEELGTDTWLYGCEINGNCIYRIKIEDSSDTLAQANIALASLQDNSTNDLPSGGFVKSNSLVDEVGENIRINSIAVCDSMPNAIWAIGSTSGQTRIFLIDVNDFYESNDPTDIMGSDGSYTWRFDTNVSVISEWSGKMPKFIAPGGAIKDVEPAGVWWASDLLETGTKFADATTGEPYDRRLWIQLYTHDGFSQSEYDGLAIDPYLFSIDISNIEADDGGVLQLTNETPNFAVTSNASFTQPSGNRTFYWNPVLWTFSNREGPNYGYDTEGYGKIRYRGEAGVDAHDGNSNNELWCMGFNIGVETGTVLKINRFSMFETFGHYGENFMLYCGGTTGGPNNPYDQWLSNCQVDSTHPTYPNYPHQVGCIASSEGKFVTFGGLLLEQQSGVGDDTFAPTIAGKSYTLGTFIAISTAGANLGYGQFLEPNPYEGEAMTTSFYNGTQYRKGTEVLDFAKGIGLLKLETTINLNYDNINCVQSCILEGGGSTGTRDTVGLFISERVNRNLEDISEWDGTTIWAIRIANPIVRPGSTLFDTPMRGAANQTNLFDSTSARAYWRFTNDNTDGHGGDILHYRTYREFGWAGRDFLGDLETDEVDWSIGGLPLMQLELGGKTSSTSVDIGGAAMCLMSKADVPIEHWGLSELASTASVIFLSAINGSYTNGMIAGDLINTTVPENFWDLNNFDGTNFTVQADQPFAQMKGEDTTFNVVGGDESDTDTISPHFAAGKRYDYKIALKYDGFQYSPISSTMWRFTPSTDYDDCMIEINIRELPIRVSNVLIYRRNFVDDTQQELFKLVADLKLHAGWKYDEELDAWNNIIRDSGNNGKETYEAMAGISETLPHMGLKWGLSTKIGTYHVVGQCSLKYSSEDYSQTIFKSAPGEFNVWDWGNDERSLHLPNIPTALTSFNGKIFAFDRHNTYRIDPDTMGIDDIYEGIGCSGREAVIVTEYGMLYADMHNIYLHDGVRPVPVGIPIKDSRKGLMGLDKVDLSNNTSVSFDAARGSFVVLTKKGASALYTEGGEFEKLGAPYIGYYNKNQSGFFYTEAFYNNRSIALTRIS